MRNYTIDLPTNPIKINGKVFVTGASGYIGGRLIPDLIGRGYDVRIGVRSNLKDYEKLFPKAEAVLFDVFNKTSIANALKGVHTAYYLIHSLLLGKKGFHESDILAAKNFAEVAGDADLNRIIYLGGLGDKSENLSPHLLSRIQVGEELKKGKTPVTILRAAIIIGSGSASYEILKGTLKKLKYIPVPSWIQSKCEPISIRDVIRYLVAVHELEDTKNKIFDIGCGEVFTYSKMLETFAEIMNKKIYLFRFPLVGLNTFSYFASLITPVPIEIIINLFESLKNNAITKDFTINKYVNIQKISFNEALKNALFFEAQDKIATRWSDDYASAHPGQIEINMLNYTTKYVASYFVLTEKNATLLFKSICEIGGKSGWFNNNWMWKLRGIVDKIFMGVGSARGRRDSKALKINDVIDYFRVEAIEENVRVLLRAEMKLPGRAWLEFKINDKGSQKKLTITAYYDTSSRFGKLYWYFFLPFHNIIFKDLLKQIENKSK